MGLFEKLKLNKNAKILEKVFPFYDDPNTATITCSHIIAVSYTHLWIAYGAPQYRRQYLFPDYCIEKQESFLRFL